MPHWGEITASDRRSEIRRASYWRRVGSCVTPIGRFMAKVDVGSACWHWVGKLDQSGYGSFRLNRRMQAAHRIAWQWVHGSIPEGLELDHLCRNRRCVNPDHLEPVTRKVNQERGMYAQQTHCRNGHPYNAENTYRRPNGHRDCRSCFRTRQRQYRERKAVAA